MIPVISEIEKKYVKINWEANAEADSYGVFWADAETPNMQYKKVIETTECTYTCRSKLLCIYGL